MAHDALGAAGRSRGVVQRNRLPLVVRRVDRSRGITSGNEILILHPVAFRRVSRLRGADLDQGWRMIDFGQGSPGNRHQLGIDQECFTLGMFQDEAHGLRVETVVDRIEDAARHTRGIVHLKRRHAIGREYRNRVVLAHAGLAQRIGPLAATPPHIGIGDDALAINDRRFGRIDERRALQKRDGGKRFVIRLVLAEGGLVFARQHLCSLPASAPSRARRLPPVSYWHFPVGLLLNRHSPDDRRLWGNDAVVSRLRQAGWWTVEGRSVCRQERSGHGARRK
jgi:hypothetical protein